MIGDGSRTVEEEQFKSNCEEVVKVYKYAFETESDEYYERFEISRELKQNVLLHATEIGIIKSIKASGKF